MCTCTCIGTCTFFVLVNNGGQLEKGQDKTDGKPQIGMFENYL